MLTGTSPTGRATCANPHLGAPYGGVDETVAPNQWPAKPFRPPTWGEKFEVSKRGKVKVNKTTPKFVTYDMDARYSPIWDEARYSPATQDHFEIALDELQRSGSREARDVRLLDRVQKRLFFDRVQHGKIRTAFMDLVLAKAMAIRMGG